MGVELFQFAFPQSVLAIQKVLDGSIRGDLLQNYAHLIKDLRHGESGEAYLRSASREYDGSQMEALRSAFETIQARPHLLAICFNGPSRGHDHWEYLLELGLDSNAARIAKETIFGSQRVGKTAVASQGIPIRWSDAKQVAALNLQLESVDIDVIRDRFNGFPEDRTFYKPRTDDELDASLRELMQIIEFYSLAAENELAIFTILD